MVGFQLSCADSVFRLPVTSIYGGITFEKAVRPVIGVKAIELLP
jgi:hypothetical protein